MCGICGIFCPDGRPVAPERVERVREAMRPRGPDDCGLEHGPGFVLGHRRLSILDLSAAGHQPMSNEDGSVLIVFNGEIYNFVDLRAELALRNHVFRSRTDTEVLVHGYETWGIEGLVRRIRGMYAFAIVDSARREIHLVRDPLGEKPLFFRWSGGELAFASSARALVQGLPATPAVDPLAVDDLLWNLYVPGRRSIFAGVEKLLPGYGWSLGRDAQPREWCHWQPDFFHPEHDVREEAWLERIEDTLSTAVKRRMVADVPVGVLLSGGVDSSLVTALAAKAVGQVKTYSVANEDPARDESAYARAVAQRYHTDHHVLPVRSSIRRDLTRLVAGMGEPMGDASAANLFAIAQLARQSVTVVLMGDGGDEAFGGYTEFFAAYYAEKVGRFLPGIIRPLATRSADLLRRGPGIARRAGTFLRIACRPLRETVGSSVNLDLCGRETLYTPEFRAVLQHRHPGEYRQDLLAHMPAASMVDRLMQTHLQTVLADDFLPKVDLATMSAGLEARCPFLDLDVVELGMRIPAAMRFRGMEPKGLLRKLARRHLPREVVNRRKQGFSAPVGMWVSGDWTDLIEGLLLGPEIRSRGWFRRDAIQQLVREHRQGKDHAYLLWTLLILEIWLRIVVDGSLSPGDIL
jgi:asparagine synthase (glutamine-hydrolysing)